MAEVHLWSGLRAYADGAEVVEVDGHTTGELLRGLATAYPALAPIIDAGVSFAINGRVIAYAEDEPVPDGAEVYLLQRIKGG